MIIIKITKSKSICNLFVMVALIDPYIEYINVKPINWYSKSY